jgi:hypothetical protein
VRRARVIGHRDRSGTETAASFVAQVEAWNLDVTEYCLTDLDFFAVLWRKRRHVGCVEPRFRCH